MVGLVLVLALVFRLATGIFLGMNAPPDRAACGADTVEFELGAWNMAQGNGFVLWEDGAPSAFRAPGYPLMLAGLYRLFGRQYWMNRVVLSLLGALTCLVVYRLGLALRFGHRVALCGMLVAALHPLQAYFCGHFMSEVPSAFLNVLATLFLVKGCRLAGGVGSGEWGVGSGRVRTTVHPPPSTVFFIALAGVVNGLSVLVRPAAIFLVPIFGGLLVLQGWRRPLRAMLLAVVFGIGTLVAVAPWTLRNYRVFDRFCLVASNGGSTLWGANNAVTATVGGKHWGYWISTGFDPEVKQREVLSLANEVDRDRREWALGVEFLKSNPAKIPGLLAGKLYRVVSPFPLSANRVFVLMAAASQVVMLLLCMAGLVVMRERVLAVIHLPVLAQFLALTATVLVFYGSERFRMPYEPVFAVYAGAGLAVLCSGLYHWKRRR